MIMRFTRKIYALKVENKRCCTALPFWGDRSNDEMGFSVIVISVW